MMISGNKKELELPILVCKQQFTDYAEYCLDWKNCEDLKIKKYNEFLSNKNKLQIKNFGKFVPELNDEWNEYLKRSVYKLNKKSLEEFNYYRKLAIMEYSKEAGMEIAIKSINNMHYFLFDTGISDYVIEDLQDINIHYTLFHLKILIHVHPLTNLTDDSRYFSLQEKIEKHDNFKIFYHENHSKIIDSYTLLPKESTVFKRRIRTEKIKRITQF